MVFIFYLSHSTWLSVLHIAMADIELNIIFNSALSGFAKLLKFAASAALKHREQSL